MGEGWGEVGEIGEFAFSSLRMVSMHDSLLIVKRRSWIAIPSHPSPFASAPVV